MPLIAALSASGRAATASSRRALNRCARPTGSLTDCSQLLGARSFFSQRAHGTANEVHEVRRCRIARKISYQQDFPTGTSRSAQPVRSPAECDNIATKGWIAQGRSPSPQDRQPAIRGERRLTTWREGRRSTESIVKRHLREPNGFRRQSELCDGQSGARKSCGGRFFGLMK